MTSSSPESTTPLVRVEGVTRVYSLGQTEIHALRGLDLTIGRGELVAITGASGSGKTTLLNLIGGLDQPTSGHVYFNGRDIAGLPEEELIKLRRHEIGFVFQSFALLPTFSAFENVDLVLRLAGVRRRERRARALACLEAVGLADRAHHRPYELSGGQRQRVAIAKALANEPALILADEPTGELDSATGRQILQLLGGLVHHKGVTVIVATHDPTIRNFATMIYELQDGRVTSHRAAL